MNKKLELLLKLKKASDIYHTGNLDQKNRLYRACKPLFKELEKYGEHELVSTCFFWYATPEEWKSHLLRAGDKEASVFDN